MNFNKMERVKPFKSENDPKDYLGLVLGNGLKLLLVSDSQCDKASVSVSVGTGRMSDPDDIPGLAHLCEHLLSIENPFSGNRSKPFNIFVAENGGLFNAFTTRDQTNFYFDINPSVFANALQRFANFFTSMPSLTEDDISREIIIVDSENSNKIKNDAWRKMAIDSATAKRNHPYFKFTTGNTKTLLEIPREKGISVLKAAQDFRSIYYVSNLITAVVYGKDNIKTLEALAVPLFSKVPSRQGAELPEWKEWPYGDAQLKQKISIIPVADVRDLYLVFPIDNTRPYYKTFPHGYITRLLANRGSGSLYSYLYEKHWVQNLYMQSSVPARGFGELSIGFQLTKLGFQYVDEIVLHTFQYIKMLDTKGPQFSFWKEMQQILNLQFVYQDKESPVEFVQKTSNIMHVYPFKDVLSTGSIISDYKPEIIQKFMNYLKPENCRIITVGKENSGKFSNLLQCHWYGAEYAVTEFTENELKMWKDCKPLKSFHLPGENKFISTNFDLERKSKERESHLICLPKLVLDSSLSKAWFIQDAYYFKQPKGVIRCDIFSRIPLSCPTSFTLNQIWCLTLKNILNEEFHQATVAGSCHEIKPTLYGAEVTVFGFSHKLFVLMESIFQRILHSIDQFDTLQNYFASVKDKYQIGLLNSCNLQLPHLSTYYLSLLLREMRFSNEELLEALQGATENKLKEYINEFFFRSHFEWFAYGNFDQTGFEDHTKACMASVSEIWSTGPICPSQLHRMREVCLTEGRRFVYKQYSKQSTNSCTILIQAGVLEERESVIFEIIDQIVFEPLFTQLRTRERIGYTVRSSIRKSNGCQGLLIFVQGDKEPSYISERILEGLTDIEKQLVNMNEKDFNQHKLSVRIRKAEQPKTMLQFFNKVWNNEIYSKRYDFERIANELKELNEITHEEVVKFFRVYISNTSQKRRVLQIYLRKMEGIPEIPTEQRSPQRRPNSSVTVKVEKSKNKTAEKSETAKNYVITNIMKWKQSMHLYPARAGSCIT